MLYNEVLANLLYICNNIYSFFSNIIYALDDDPPPPISSSKLAGAGAVTKRTAVTTQKRLSDRQKVAAFQAALMRHRRDDCSLSSSSASDNYSITINTYSSRSFDGSTAAAAAAEENHQAAAQQGSKYHHQQSSRSRTTFYFHVTNIPKLPMRKKVVKEGVVRVFGSKLQSLVVATAPHYEDPDPDKPFADTPAPAEDVVDVHIYLRFKVILIAQCMLRPIILYSMYVHTYIAGRSGKLYHRSGR